MRFLGVSHGIPEAFPRDLHDVAMIFLSDF